MAFGVLKSTLVRVLTFCGRWMIVFAIVKRLLGFYKYTIIIETTDCPCFIVMVFLQNFRKINFVTCSP